MSSNYYLRNRHRHECFLSKNQPRGHNMLLLLLLLLLMLVQVQLLRAEHVTRDGIGGGILIKHTKHQSNFGYFRKDPFETLNKVKHARLESVEHQVSHAKTNQIFRLFSEGRTHCNVLFFGQPKKTT